MTRRASGAPTLRAMQRPDRIDLAVIVGCAVVAGIAVLLLEEGVPEWLFFAVLLASSLILARTLGRSWRSQQTERRRARLLESIDPSLVANVTVRRERAALHDDIRRSLCNYLEEVVRVSSRGAISGQAAARQIRQASQEASAELRRQLGLLRDGEEPSEVVVTPAAPPRTVLTFTDLLIGAFAGILGLTEAYAYRIVENMDRSLLAVALTAAAAFGLAWRRRAPAAACLIVGALFVLGAALGEGLIGGFWVIVTVGGLTWAAVATRGNGWAAAGAGCALVALAGVATGLTEPDNAALTWIVLAILLSTAALARLVREMGARAAIRADGRAQILGQEQRKAREAERRSMARDLHDVVSHAVGLIAMQAAAAEVSWDSDRDSSLGAFRIIEETAVGALAELERFDPDTAMHRRTHQDLKSLVERINAAGNPVTANGLDAVPDMHLDVTYRLLQEALTNTLRHARGARVVVDSRVDSASFRLRVSDDGPGARADAARGYGLVGLRERVALAGGALRVLSPSAGGFVIEADLPLRSREEAPA